ncbi:hypothetical protein CCR75_002458 [Bremia lactucae]|uniref:Uncharacterized protein n=1 Tax=Bremia lactucae TaxID=4779 RepID=A0A976I9T7_BRELC|nr:hypothetical protein CCR75_002458 [Bremia lactucae]
MEKTDTGFEAAVATRRDEANNVPLLRRLCSYELIGPDGLILTDEGLAGLKSYKRLQKVNWYL